MTRREEALGSCLANPVVVSPGKNLLIRRGLLCGILLVLVALSSALAWSKAGHMVSGAIAYADLK